MRGSTSWSLKLIIRPGLKASAVRNGRICRPNNSKLRQLRLNLSSALPINKFTMHRFKNLISVSFMALTLHMPAFAQQKLPPVTPPLAASSTATAVVTPAPQISAATIDGKPFNLSAFKGQVVPVMFWSTSCAACRNKMPELRGNYEGWAGKPFDLVAISTDSSRQDVLDYERIILRTVPLKQRFVQIWAGDSGYKDNLGIHGMLPAAYLLKKEGKVIERDVGRIPAEAWDKILDLL